MPVTFALPLVSGGDDDLLYFGDIGV